MYKKTTVIIFVIGLFMGCQVSVTPSAETAEKAKEKLKNGKIKIEKSDESGKTKEVTIKNSEDPSISIKVKKEDKSTENNDAESVAVSDEDIDSKETESQKSSEDDIFVDGNSKNLEFDCEGRNVIIEGNNHIINLNGECNLLSVMGNGHRIDVETISSIKVTGNDIQVIYEYGAKNRKPRIKKTGRNNKVFRKRNKN